MFRSYTGKQYNTPGDKPVMVVIEKREKAYRDEKGFTVAKGLEIVKEIAVGQDEVAEIVARGVKVTYLPTAIKSFTAR